MALTLDEISAMPEDPEELHQHLVERGLVVPPTPPPEPPPMIPSAKVAPLSAAEAGPRVGPISPITKGPNSFDSLGMMASASGAPRQPNEHLTAGEAPEIGGAPAGGEIGGAGGGIPSTPVVPALTAPTRKESAAAGKAEYAAGRPQVTAAINTPEFFNQKAAQIEYDRAHPWGSDISAHPGVGGKILHTLGEIGQVAGNMVNPEIVASIPGTRSNMNIREATDLAQADKAAERERLGKTAETENAARAATTAETVQRTAKTGTEQNLIQDAQGYVTGYKTGDGVVHSIDDPDTPQAIKDVAADTEAKTIKPTIEKMDNGDIVAITPGRGGAAPTSNVVYHGDPKLETELTQRTVGGQEHKILVNKKTGEDIKDLGAFKTEASPASLLAHEKAGEEVVLAYDKNNHAHLMSKADAQEEGMGHITKAQPGDIDKAKTHHVVLNTLQTQLNSVVNSSKALDQGIVQRGIIASALSHPTNSTVDELMRAAVLKGASEETKDYVVAVLALREAGLALPKEITGGSRVAEIQASALWQTMPSAGSLNSKYALKQAKKFQQDIDRLRERAPEVRGQTMVDPDEAIRSKGTEKQHTTNAPAGGAPPPPAGKTTVYDQQGAPHFVNSDKVEKFLKDPKYQGWSKNAPTAGR